MSNIFENASIQSSKEKKEITDFQVIDTDLRTFNDLNNIVISPYVYSDLELRRDISGLLSGDNVNIFFELISALVSDKKIITEQVKHFNTFLKIENRTRETDNYTDITIHEPSDTDYAAQQSIQISRYFVKKRNTIIGLTKQERLQRKFLETMNKLYAHTNINYDPNADALISDYNVIVQGSSSQYYKRCIGSQQLLSNHVYDGDNVKVLSIVISPFKYLRKKIFSIDVEQYVGKVNALNRESKDITVLQGVYKASANITHITNEEIHLTTHDQFFVFNRRDIWANDFIIMQNMSYDFNLLLEFDLELASTKEVSKINDIVSYFLPDINTWLDVLDDSANTDILESLYNQEIEETSRNMIKTRLLAKHARASKQSLAYLPTLSYENTTSFDLYKTAIHSVKLNIQSLSKIKTNETKEINKSQNFFVSWIDVLRDNHNVPKVSQMEISSTYNVQNMHVPIKRIRDGNIWKDWEIDHAKAIDVFDVDIIYKSINDFLENHSNPGEKGIIFNSDEIIKIKKITTKIGRIWDIFDRIKGRSDLTNIYLISNEEKIAFESNAQHAVQQYENKMNEIASKNQMSYASLRPKPIEITSNEQDYSIFSGDVYFQDDPYDRDPLSNYLPIKDDVYNYQFKNHLTYNILDNIITLLQLVGIDQNKFEAIAESIKNDIVVPFKDADNFVRKKKLAYTDEEKIKKGIIGNHVIAYLVIFIQKAIPRNVIKAPTFCSNKFSLLGYPIEEDKSIKGLIGYLHCIFSDGLDIETNKAKISEIIDKILESSAQFKEQIKKAKLNISTLRTNKQPTNIQGYQEWEFFKPDLNSDFVGNTKFKVSDIIINQGNRYKIVFQNYLKKFVTHHSKEDINTFIETIDTKKEATLILKEAHTPCIPSSASIYGDFNFKSIGIENESYDDMHNEMSRKTLDQSMSTEWIKQLIQKQQKKVMVAKTIINTLKREIAKFCSWYSRKNDNLINVPDKVYENVAHGISTFLEMLETLKQLDTTIEIDNEYSKDYNIALLYIFLFIANKISLLKNGPMFINFLNKKIRDDVKYVNMDQDILKSQFELAREKFKNKKLETMRELSQEERDIIGEFKKKGRDISMLLDNIESQIPEVDQPTGEGTPDEEVFNNDGDE